VLPEYGFFFPGAKLSPTEMGVKKFYEFKYCLEFISAISESFANFAFI